MTKVIIHRKNNLSRSVKYNLYFLGDIHIGHPGDDLGRVKRIVNRIKEDENAIWIGMGDQINAINIHDPRFETSILPDWILSGSPSQIKKNLSDIISTQKRKYVEIFSPIAGKCLGLLKGNHEQKVEKWHERSIHREIVDAMKSQGGLDHKQELDLGYTGWIVLSLARTDNGKRGGVKTITINVHHGASTAESRHKKYIMQTQADIVAWGHSHKLEALPHRLRAIVGGEPQDKYRWGCWTGTMHDDIIKGESTWSEMKGHLAPVGGVKFALHPYATRPEDQIRGEVFLY